jgi:hypothetical protein
MRDAFAAAVQAAADIGRLDLSIESLMLQPRFAGLFSPQELDAARWRLEQA